MEQLVDAVRRKDYAFVDETLVHAMKVRGIDEPAWVDGVQLLHIAAIHNDQKMIYLLHAHSIVEGSDRFGVAPSDLWAQGEFPDAPPMPLWDETNRFAPPASYERLFITDEWDQVAARQVAADRISGLTLHRACTEGRHDAVQAIVEHYEVPVTFAKFVPALWNHLQHGAPAPSVAHVNALTRMTDVPAQAAALRASIHSGRTLRSIVHTLTAEARRVGAQLFDDVFGAFIDRKFSTGVRIALEMGHEVFPGDEMLLRAIGQKAEGCLRVMLEYGTDPNERDQNADMWMHTALRDAYQLGNVGMVTALLDYGATVETTIDDEPAPVVTLGNSLPASLPLITRHAPLFTSRAVFPLLAREEKPDIIRLLIKLGADPNAAFRGRMTPFIEACRHGSFENARVMLAHGVDINAYHPNRLTPLMTFCVVDRHIDTVRFLLEHGADPNLREPGKRSCLHIAAHTGSRKILYALLEAGADPTVTRAGGITIADEAEGHHDAALYRILKQLETDPEEAIRELAMSV